MLFNSVDFAVFLPVIFGLYWLVGSKKIKRQNSLIVVSSYVFYGWWDWRFLSLILFSTIVDYTIGLWLSKEDSHTRRKTLLWTSVIVNLGLLGFFKYYNFFIDNFTTAFSFFGTELDARSLNIILPIGISFYTFQTLSYTIDIYRRKIEPTKDFIAFAAFVSFFPQLVAGPIERASTFLPQFQTKRTFDANNAVDGMRQILWGLFKKLVIADSCAEHANMIFNNSADYSGSTLLLGALFFSFQIYGDFSGYSDIAIGTSRLFGFKLMRNFAFPYFSRDIAEFWRRWHISLTTWFRDYLYIPLGGSQNGIRKNIRNIFIIFLVSGFWHGANWTFIAWGALNAVYLLPLLLLKRNRKNIEGIAHGKLLPTITEFFAVLITFFMTLVAWVFFRSDSITHAVSILSEIFSKSLFSTPHFIGAADSIVTAILVVFFVGIEWVGREKQYAIADLGLNWPRLFRWTFYSFIVFLIGMFMPTEETPFIYFQF